MSRFATGLQPHRMRSPVERGRGFWVLFLLLLSATTATGLGVVYSTYTGRQLLNTLQQMEQRRNRLQDQWGRLLLEQSSMVAQGRVEETAIAELGMEAPDMKKVVVFKSD